jgi:hypothetical protein
LYTGEFGGTSAAAPVIAGIVGLVRSVGPSLSAAQTITVLASTADRVGGDAYLDGRNDDYGYGRGNLGAALDMLASGAGRACSSAAECGPAGECLMRLGGSCTLACANDAECPSPLFCAQLAGAARACLRPCEDRGDCRLDQACWPAAEGGACWTACVSDDECSGEPCNALGSCGALDLVPAVTDGTCICDTTFGCEVECPCDPECPLVPVRSCNGTAGEPMLVVLAGLLVWRLRFLGPRRDSRSRI